MLVGIVVFASAGFWMLMVFDCVRNEPKGSSWLWVTIGLNFIGTIIYFAIRKLPDLDLPMPTLFKRWTMKDALWNAEAGVYNIGKSHQYVTLGNVLSEMGNLNRALESYQEALYKETSNLDALWGCAIVEMQQQKFDRAAEHLKTLISKEPEYKRGEASLLYGKVLYELAKWEKATRQLDRDIQQWSHPESFILLAKIAIKERKSEIAEFYLETMLAKVKASPRSNYRKNQ